MSFEAVITADIRGFVAATENVADKANEMAKRIKDSTEKIGDAFISVGQKLSILSAALVAAGGKAYLMAADFQDAMGTTEQFFGDSAKVVQDWANDLSSSYGVAKDEALSYSNMMGTMLVNIGQLTKKEAAEQSAKLIELAGDLTAMYGGTTADAVRALTGALKGNATMLDNYGMAVNQALIQTKALELGLSDGTGKLSLHAKQAATLALIWEQTGAAQGQAARGADGASGTMRALQTDIKNLSIELGEVLLPIIKPIIGKIRDMIASFRELSPETKKMIVVIGGVVAAFGPALIGVGTFIKTLPLLVSGFGAVTKAAGVVAGAIGGISLPVAAVVAAVVGAVVLIVKNWDKIKEYFTSGGGSDLFNSIKEFAYEVKNVFDIVFPYIKEFFIQAWELMKKALQPIIDVIVGIVKSFITSLTGMFRILSKLLKGDFAGAWKEYKKMVSAIFAGIWETVVKTLKSMAIYIAEFFDFIGADKWANSLRTWGNSATKAVKEVKDAFKPLADSGEIMDESVLNKSISKVKDLTKEIKAVPEEKTVRINVHTDLKSKMFGKIDWDKFFKWDEIVMPEHVIAKTTEAFTKLKESIKNGVDVAKDEYSKLPEHFDVIRQALIQMVESIAMALGESWATGTNALKAAGKAMLGTLGGILINLGKMVLATAKGIKAVKLALKSLQWYIAIPVGMALIALGSAFAAGANKMGDSMGSGGGGGGGGYSGTSNLKTTPIATPGYTEYRPATQAVEFRIGVNELVGVLNVAQNKKNRL